jgi:hypothetical protein
MTFFIDNAQLPLLGRLFLSKNLTSVSAAIRDGRVFVPKDNEHTWQCRGETGGSVELRTQMGYCYKKHSGRDLDKDAKV